MEGTDPDAVRAHLRDAFDRLSAATLAGIGALRRAHIHRGLVSTVTIRAARATDRRPIQELLDTMQGVENALIAARQAQPPVPIAQPACASYKALIALCSVRAEEAPVRASAIALTPGTIDAPEPGARASFRA